MFINFKDANFIKCIYNNESDRVAILRINHQGHWLERVIEPGKTLLFEADRQAYLEIYTYEFATMVLSEKIACLDIAFCENSIMKNVELMLVACLTDKS